MRRGLPEQIFEAAISRAVRRAQLLAAIEAASVGAAVSAWSIPGGLAASLACGFFLSARTSRHAVVRRVDAAVDARNVLVTADELRAGVIRTTAEIRERVFGDAARCLDGTDARRAFPTRTAWVLALVALTIWSGMGVYRPESALSRNRASGPQVQPTQPAAPSSIQISARITAPLYTRLPVRVLENAREIEAIENSLVDLTIRAAASTVAIEAGGETTRLIAASGEFKHRIALRRTGFLVVSTDDGRRRTIPVTVVPDALPAVRVVAPGRDLVYGAGNPRVDFRVDATDDFGLESLTLRYTRVAGSGETFAFADGEIPLSVTSRTDRAWRAETSRTVAELGLQEGDMLVYRAAARDARPGGLEGVSDAYFIEISRLGAAAGDAFTLPEQETRFALSQQMLILKTERLNARAPRLAPGDLLEQSQNLAVEQRMIRSEFVFMLGGEVEDEEVEAEQSTELQEGRLANRGQRDLRLATVAMSQAEALLTGGHTSQALTAERAAVAALQRAFARDRYILRALAGRTTLDESRRLSAATAEAIGWRRNLLAAPENRRAVQLQGLLQSLGEFLDAARDRDVEQRLAVAAELAVRIDTASARLRTAATQLEQLADMWSSLRIETRVSTLEAIAGLIVEETRSAVADAPFRFDVSLVQRGGLR